MEDTSMVLRSSILCHGNSPVNGLWSVSWATLAARLSPWIFLPMSMCTAKAPGAESRAWGLLGGAEIQFLRETPTPNL